LTIDHIVPLAVGGSDRLDNLQPAHRMCNVEKGDDLPTWWARKSKAERR
jgi:5-methylcytosine-specific restriction endonuclease McrA